MAPPDGRSVVQEAAPAFAAEQLWRRQNPLRPSVSMPSLLTEADMSEIAAPKRFDCSVVRMPGDLFDHRRAPRRAAVMQSTGR